MNKLMASLFALMIVGCTKPPPVGKRVSVAKGNVSFILPDSALLYSKLKPWGPCCSSCSYTETNAFFHNPDSSVITSVSVTAFPDILQRTLPWHAIDNEKQQRSDLLAKSMGLAVIEHYAADSATRTIDIEYH